MKLSEVMTALIDKLKTSETSPKMVEPYEGQFEDVENFIIVPPAIFIDFPSGGKSGKITNNNGVDVALYICTQNLHSKSQISTMLDTIETLEKEVLKMKTLPFYFIQYNGFEKLGNFPGFKFYQMNFRIE